MNEYRIACVICNCEDASITYKGKIRSGKPGMMTKASIPVYRCALCDCIWHDKTDADALYHTNEYRESMGESVSLEEFYSKHDDEILTKLKYTGTSVYRNKLFMDIGCGGGGYADYINGVASKIVLVEPNNTFQQLLKGKGYEVFAYPEDACRKYACSIEVLTTFDVIEHVDDPRLFMQTIFNLLAPGGVAFVGTPTEYPVLRELLGEVFDSFVFSTQHPWVFSKKSLEHLACECGFPEFKTMFFQRFGIGNLIAWLQTNKPSGDIHYEFVTKSLDELYKSEMAKEETGEYVILKVQK
jgi:SAM-dependent methyltransferase